MNSFKIYCFLVILLICLSYGFRLNNSNEARILLRSDILNENVLERDSFDGEATDLIINQPVPRNSFNQYRVCLNINILIFLIHEISIKLNYNFKYFFIFSLILNVIGYLRTFDASRNNSPSHYIYHWSLAPLSWITEVLLLLSPENYLYLADKCFLPAEKTFLYFIFFLQMVYYLSGFNSRNPQSINRD